MGPGSSPVGWTCRCKPTWWDPNRGSSWGGSGWFIAKIVINQCSMLSWGCYIFCKPVCAYNIIIYIYIVVVAVYENYVICACKYVCSIKTTPPAAQVYPTTCAQFKNMLDQLGFNYWPPAIRGMLTPTPPTLRQTMRHKGMLALWNTASSAAEAASRHGYHMLSHFSIIISQILRIRVPSHKIFGYVLGGEVCLQEVD